VNEPLPSQQLAVLPAKRKTSKRKAEEAGLDDGDNASFQPVQHIWPDSSSRCDEMIAISRPVGGNVTKWITVHTQTTGTPKHVATAQRITVQIQPSNPSAIKSPQSDLAAEGQLAKRKMSKRKVEEAGLVDSDPPTLFRPVQRRRPNGPDEPSARSSSVEVNVTQRVTVQTQASGTTKRVGAAQRITVQIQPSKPSKPSAIGLPSPQLSLATEDPQDRFTVSEMQTREEVAFYFHPTPLEEDEHTAATEKGAGNAASDLEVSRSMVTCSEPVDEDVLMKGIDEPMDMDIDGVSEVRPEDVVGNALEPVRPTDLNFTAYLQIRIFESRKSRNHTVQCTVPVRDGSLYADAVSRELGKTQPFWVSTSSLCSEVYSLEL
jgi:hypothetical protein